MLLGCSWEDMLDLATGGNPPPPPPWVLIVKLLCYLRYCKHRSPAGALQYALDRLQTRLGLQTS